MVLTVTLLCPPLQVSAATYTITVSVKSGSENISRAEFYTAGAATVKSTGLTSGSDPALYNTAGMRIADDEAGSSHWQYAAVSGVHYFAGTYSHGAATYTISSDKPITLVRNGTYNWPAALGGYEGYYKIKHVQSGKYLTAVTASPNQYNLTLSASSASDYQRWRIKTVNASGKSYNIINGGYTTRYLSTDTSASIYFLDCLDGYKSKLLTSAFTCVTAGVPDAVSTVYIRNSGAQWALETNVFGDTAPQFYDNITGGWELGEWKLEPVYIKGDVNMDGAVTQADVDLALRASALLVTLNSLQTFLADMDNNGALQASDANKISQML